MVERDEDSVLPRTGNALAAQGLSQQLSLLAPKLGFTTHRCCPASHYSKQCPRPINCLLLLGLRNPPVSRERSCPCSLSFLPLPEEKSSELKKSALRGQEFDTFHWNNVLKQKRITQKPPFQKPRQLWLSAPSGCSRIPLQICSFLLPPPPGPLGFQKSRKSKKGMEKSSSLLNPVQGWMCPASQRARPGGKTRTEAYTTGRQLRRPWRPSRLWPGLWPPGPQPSAGSGAFSRLRSGRPPP